ncbi:MAG TPA: DUF4386 domain-containing protein [Actinomycetota bacterium]|jgi:hypothetical protein|nr:DUF4386 domain-containing protein [Actinomycetota bacterium]
MTVTTASPHQRRQPEERPPTPYPHEIEERSVRNAGLVAGVAILLMSALAIFGNFIVLEGLVTPGDASATAKAITGSLLTFRLGIVSLLMIVVLDVVVSWGLFRAFAPVNEGLSRLAAWFRLAYSGVFLVAIGHLAGVVRLLGTEGYLAAFSLEQRQVQALLEINAFTDIWDAGLVLFGAHLLIAGFLTYRSGFVPKFVGVLLVIAGFGYIFDSVAATMAGGAFPAISSFTFLGEFVLALWLVVRGRRIRLDRPSGYAGRRQPEGGF